MSDENEPTTYAERMFPAPVDHGIAREDRAVPPCTPASTPPSSVAWQNERWYQGGGRIGEKAVERITIYPPTRGM